MASTVPVAKNDLGWMFRLLSAVMSALAIVALARHAFVTWSLSAPMALVMDAYNGAMQVLFGWAHPYLQAALTWLGSFVGWRPTLYPHWRDVLVVTGVIGAGVFQQNKETDIEIGFIASTIFVATMLAGLLPLQSENLLVQLLFAASFWLLAASVAFFSWALDGDLETVLLSLTFGSIAATVTWLLSLAFGSPVGLGLLGMAASISLLGVYVLWNDPGYALARIILGGYLGAFCFFAIDAGLKLLGT